MTAFFVLPKFCLSGDMGIINIHGGQRKLHARAGSLYIDITRKQ